MMAHSRRVWPGRTCRRFFDGQCLAPWRSFSSETRNFKAEDSVAKTTLIYPSPPTSQHSDLATFLAYAKRSGLNPKSTVYVGTHYEYTTAESLSRYGFSLQRIGGSSDYGTDLLGEWTPPSTSQSLRVLLQCKGGTQKTGPHHVRELEGAFAGAPVGWRGAGVLGLLVSERDATKGVRDALGRSRWPMGYICCSREGLVKQMLWNQQAEEHGLEGFGVVLKRYDENKDPELVLSRNGSILPILGRTSN